MFKDRSSTGKLLAEKLQDYRNKALVLAIPRGGVPVAIPIAQSLHLPLALVLTKKIGHPNNKEYAIGAASLTDYFVTEISGVSSVYIEEEVFKIQQRLNYMKNIFNHDFTSFSLEDKTIILVDDGMATGRTALHTVQLLRKYNPKKIIMALPVASVSAVELIQTVVDEVVVLNASIFFQAVGHFYENFAEVTDDDVIKLLENTVTV
jgi:putative phosphoribosyl transferase